MRSFSSTRQDRLPACPQKHSRLKPERISHWQPPSRLQVRQLEAYDQRLTRYIGYIEDSSTSDDVWDSINLTAGHVQDALEALADAEQAVADGSADRSLTEAKQNLEAILSHYQAAELPTGWDADDFRQAHDELNSAIDDLRSAL